MRAAGKFMPNCWFNPFLKLTLVRLSIPLSMRGLSSSTSSSVASDI
eukprot:CAMPEP_0195032704 /NCGR_PEP_ID=MMETSP0326_2-20130528/64085_1 /TAXON_ID=2866 ORGANISM="Crypthecodinium cohnii, Strain Seligo" /NCGR_SAMPLE_ID=MMETSP0326_2 /ASSEMBLY_ACC=CAM_ASM_000348 /LENGTH=45 /DNA_ID= /DNA_START= /DNA_END= /DNA_ORIENTATION=